MKTTGRRMLKRRSFLLPKNTTEYHISNSSVRVAVCKFYDAFWEIDLLIAGYSSHRDLCEAIIEIYQNKKGVKYEKAQRAALEGDEDARAIEKLEARRNKLLEAFHKWWGVYVGNKEYGVIVGEFIASGGDEVMLRKDHDPAKIRRALAIWRAFCDRALENTIHRYGARRNVYKGAYKNGYWWLEDI